jgi:hypothetical protein
MGTLMSLGSLARAKIGTFSPFLCVQEMLQRWEPLTRHILGLTQTCEKITNAAAEAAAQQQLACVASLLQLPQIAAAVEAPLMRGVQVKLQAALKALSDVNAPMQPPQATAAAAAGAGTSGLTLGQLKRQMSNSATEKGGCRALSSLARLLSGSDLGDSVDEVQVSALLPHIGVLLQHWQQRVEAWGGQAADARSGSSAGTPGLSPCSGFGYVRGVLLLLNQPIVAQQFAGPEQQQQVLQQLTTVSAEFQAEKKEFDKKRQIAEAAAEAEAEAAAAAARVSRMGRRSGPYRLHHLCDDLTTSPSPEAQQQLQLVAAWVQAITGKSAGPYNSPLAPLWLGRDPKLMPVREMLQRWEPLKQHILGITQTGKITNAAAAAAAQQQLACIASLLQLPQVAAAAEAALIREVQVKLQAALTALSNFDGFQAARQPPQAATAAAGAGTLGLTLGQLKEQYRECHNRSQEWVGCRALSCLARLLSGPSTSNSVDDVQVSTLLPHLGVLLQHWQQRVAGGDAGSGSSVATPPLSPVTGAAYVRGLLVLLKQRVVAQHFSGSEQQQQQQVLAQLTTVLAQFEEAAAEAAAGGTATARMAAARPGGRPLRAAATPAAVGLPAADTAATCTAVEAAAAAAAAAASQATTSPAEPQALCAAAVAAAAVVAAAERPLHHAASAAVAAGPSCDTSVAGMPDVNPTMSQGGAAAAAAARLLLQPPSPAAVVPAAPTAAALPAAAAAAAAPPSAAAADTDAFPPAAAAVAAGADLPLRAAERYLLQLYRAHLAPGREQLLRFRQAMRGLGQLPIGHQALVDFWADYEVKEGGVM